MTNSTRHPMTPAEAHPHAMRLLVELGDAIGDKDGIQAAINRTVDEHPNHWSLIVASALAHTFAEHTRLDPEWTKREGATP